MTTHTLERPQTHPRTSPRLVERVWQAPWLGSLLAVGLAGLAGAVTAAALPHGPATAVQSLFVLVSALAVGLLAGLAMKSRWALGLTPAAYVIAVEVTRRSAVGPSVDMPRLDETFGILALLLGRGLHGLVGLLPLLIGVGFGLRWAGQMAGERTGRSGWLSLALGMGTLTALVVLLIWPASTPAILAADGQPLPGSIAEVAMLPIGGQRQGVLLRGRSVDNPVLLYLAGGPGQSSLPHPRVIFQELEEDFIVVGWDQRGTGKSYAAIDPLADLTPAQAAADLIELTNYLRQRFDEEKIYLLGESYGTILGVLAVQRRPDLYHAFIGSGQMVNVAETDRRIYADLLAYAESAGDAQMADALRGYGEPPYTDLPYANAFALAHYDRLYKPYTPPQSYIDRGQTSGLDQFGILGSEYNFVEKVNVLRGLIDTFTILYPQIQEIDFRRDAASLAVPVYLLDGQAELAARRDLALAWFELLDAPIKRIFSFENAAHAVAFEEYAAFHRILFETILPETYPHP